MDKVEKPLLIFDGDCNFCMYFIRSWQRVTGDRVDFASYQEAAGRFPEISQEKFEESIQLVVPEGEIYDGAEAVFKAFGTVRSRRWLIFAYRNAPGVALISEGVYRWVARHRQGLSSMMRWWWGKDYSPASYSNTRRIFLTFLAIIYFIAFASLWIQIQGLIGENGIVPAKSLLHAVQEKLGGDRFWFFPTLAWFNSTDGFLGFLCGAGVVLSLAALTGFASAAVFFLLWALYLSLVTVGGPFMSFQWDTLLLETGFLAIFFSPFRLWAWRSDAPHPPAAILWALRFLLFRVLFSSGVLKLLSGDASWHNLTALNFHYETQPLPTWVGWYAHQLPEWFHKASVAGVFFIELILPFFIFGPRKLRLAAAVIFVTFQCLILMTGNYGFFNLITITLCLVLADDKFLGPLIPKWLIAKPAKRDLRLSEPWFKFPVVALLLVLVIIMSAVQLTFRRVELPAPVKTVFHKLGQFRLVNAYGLFAVMTTSRPEIIIEGSMDGNTWMEYRFKWKPGNPEKAPSFVAPYHPRLDWQMWFAALGNYQRNRWFINFMLRLLQGSEEALDLLDHNPFPDKPPRYIRPLLYDYRFTDFETRRQDGEWWRREFKRQYTPILKLESAPPLELF